MTEYLSKKPMHSWKTLPISVKTGLDGYEGTWILSLSPAASCSQDFHSQKHRFQLVREESPLQ